LDRVFVVLACGLLLASGVIGLRPLLLRLTQNASRRRDDAPLPHHWLSILDNSVPAIRHLSETERLHLLRASRELIATRRWEGCHGLTLTEDMKVIIATQACLLILAIPGEPFPGLREILVYPSTFVPRRVCDPRKWLHSSEPGRALPELGESWGNGVIVLSWDAVLQGAANPADGHNPVLHEFAHELAFQHDLTPPDPAILALRRGTWCPHVTDPERWQSVMEDSYEQLCGKVEAHTPSALDKYGAMNSAEFFAVATESFFERAMELRTEYPDLYAVLRTFYAQDPAGAPP
jgi:Mlc titration factor MtfA (ptsG expression regulator)